MNFAILAYAFIQGFTEFLPVSSQGHLIFFNYYFPIHNLTQLSISELTIVAHFGSFFAICIYYRRLLFRILISVRFITRPDIDRNAEILLNLIVATIPICFAGYYFAKLVYLDEKTLITIIGYTSVIFGIILYLTDKFCLRIRNIETIKKSTAFFIGLSQCLALFPGVSRAGAVLSYMRFNGFTREQALLFCNMMSIPVIFSALIFMLTKNFDAMLIDNFLNLYVVLIFFLSLLFSIIFIHFFVLWVRKSSFLIFVIYRVAFGLAIIFWFL